MTGMTARALNATGAGATDEKARHLLHVFASFGLGGVPIRICEVINGLPEGVQHTVVSLDGCFEARQRLAPHTSVAFRPLDLPAYNLLRSLGRVRGLIRSLSPDLLLTYNWGAIECALANRIAPLCRHIHFESGFGAEEGDGQLWRRNLLRRVALAKADRLVVPSRTLMAIAAGAWRVPASKLLHVPNGVDFTRYRGMPGQRDDSFLAARGFGPMEPQVTVIGTAAPLRPEKNVGRLLRAFAALPERSPAVLVVAGDGTEMDTLRALAEELKIAERTCFLGHIDDVPAALRGFDVFALSSDTEQMPNSLLQAMAAGRPVAAVDVGDVRHILAPENRPLVVPRDEEGALTQALSSLCADAGRRETLGRLNQQRARDAYSLESMVAAYGALFGLA